MSAEVAAIKLQAQLAGHLDEKKANPINALDDADVTKLLEIKKEVEARLQRAKEALELAGEAAATPAAPKLRRVI